MGVLAHRLAVAEEQTRRLKELGQQLSYEKFSSDENARIIAERRLHLCLEALMDAGLRLVSLMGLERPERYRDLPSLLVKLGVLSGEEGQLFERMVSFRNVLVHLYADLNSARVYQALERVEDLATITARLVQFLQKRGLDP